MPNLALEPAEVDAVLDYIENANPPAREADASASPRVAMPDAFLTAYLRAQEALSDDTLQGIGDAARVMSREAAALGTSGDSLTSAASGLQQSVDLLSARDAFGRLSDAIVALTGTSGSAVGDGFSVVYCPMTRHYWLQRGTAIRNPYYGQRMLECGRVITALPNSGSQR